IADVGHRSGIHFTWTLPSGILHRQALPPRAGLGGRISFFTGHPVSDRLLAGNLSHSDRAVVSGARPDRHNRRGGLFVAKWRSRRTQKAAPGVVRGRSDPDAVQRTGWRGAVDALRLLSVDGWGHAVPLGLSGAKAACPRQIRLLSPACPRE